MRKIPVFRSIARAYGFGFGRFPTAVAICWLPYSLMVIAAVLVVMGPAHDLLTQSVSVITEHLNAAGDDSAKEFDRAFQSVASSYGNFYRYAILLFLLNMLLNAMVAIGLTRASMGLDPGEGFFYLSFDAPVWKLFGAWLATYLIMYAATFVVVFLGVIVAAIFGVGFAHAGTGAIPVFVVFCAALVFAALTVMTYLAIRLNFFLPAIIVSEKKLDLLRSWNLSEGNVWRIFWIYISFLPVLIVLLLAGTLAKLIAVLGYLPHWVALPQRLAENADWQTWTWIAGNVLPWLPPLIALALLAQILFSAMLYAATARAYRDIVATDIAPQTERE